MLVYLVCSVYICSLVSLGLTATFVYISNSPADYDMVLVLVK